MNETKIQHITTSHGDTFEITDRDGNQVTLSPEEAVLVLQFLYERAGELTRLVNGEQEANPYQLSNGFIEAVTGEQETIGEDGEPYVNLYATQNPRDPAYWNAPGIDTGPAHYNPRIGLEPEQEAPEQ